MSSGSRPSSMRSAPPELSVVLPTDDYETIRPVIERLRAQTIRDRLEIVLVASEPRAIEERTDERMQEYELHKLHHVGFR